MSTSKPRSMMAGARNVLRSNDSNSLWNCTLSPGWTEEESEILRKALMKFGVGNWAKIIESGCLPGKTNAQMNLQLQRLLGQQSTAEFANLHIDAKMVGARNSLITGSHIRRKNNCIVNTGAKPSRDELRQRVMANKKEYELPEAEWKDIELPTVNDPSRILEQKRIDLKRLKVELMAVKENIAKMRCAHPDRMEKLKYELSRSESPSTPSSPGTPSSPSTPFSSGTPDLKQEDVDMVDMDTPNTDDDFAVALALQKEEDELREMADEDIDDDDFNHAKKRKVARI